MPSSRIFWLLFLIASPHINAQIKHKHNHKSISDHDEPLLRFPFAKFLANPCGLRSLSPLLFQTIDDIMPSNLHNDDLYKLRPLLNEQPADSDLEAGKINSPVTSLSQESLQFLEPLRQQYNIDPNSFTAEKQFFVVKEFLLALKQVKYRTQLLQLNMMDQHECEHIQMSSLPDVDKLITNSKDEFDLNGIYHALAIAAAHLHLMTRDTFSLPNYRITRNCHSMDEPIYQQNLRVLTGKVETLMCLMFVLPVETNSTAAVKGYDDKTRSDQFFQVIHQVLQTYFHHNYQDCSARELRRCLVISFANRVFDVVHKLGLSKRLHLDEDN